MKPTPGLRVINDAAGHLFPIEDCRAQLEVMPVDQDSDGNLTHPNDDLILGYLDAAVQMAEDFTGLSIAVRTYEMALDRFPGHVWRGSWGSYYSPYGYGFSGRSYQHGLSPARRNAIELPLGPLIEVLAFTNGDGSDLVTLVEGEDFVVDLYHEIPLLIPVTCWPTVPSPCSPNTVKVQFIAGYQPDSDGNSGVPMVIRQAIMLTLGDWYKNREDSNDKEAFLLPNGAQALLRPRRIRLGMA